MHLKAGPTRILWRKRSIALLSFCLLVNLATACGLEQAATATPSKQMLPVKVATATSDHLLGLASPPDASQIDPAAGKVLLGHTFPSYFLPLEQDVYATPQSLEQIKSFYDTQLTGTGFTKETDWFDMGQGIMASSWSKQDTQVTIVYTPHIQADQANNFNSTYNITQRPLKEGDNLVYLIGRDRSKPLN